MEYCDAPLRDTSIITFMCKIETSPSDSHCLFNEMATFGAAQWGIHSYKIAIHGATSCDRQEPHIHIFRLDDRELLNPQFNCEISLDDIISKGEINLVYQSDIENGLECTRRNQCSWSGYDEILFGFRAFLEADSDMKFFDRTVTNLQRAIF